MSKQIIPFLITHGQTKTPEYRVWADIIARCTNPNKHNYHRYGGRGITVCKRWRDFKKFFEDIGKRPSPRHQIDRKNNNKGYCPSNCRWVTRSQNNRNRRTNVLLTFKGKTQTAIEWSEETGIALSVIYARVKRGWNHKKILTTPVITKHLRIYNTH